MKTKTNLIQNIFLGHNKPLSPRVGFNLYNVVLEKEVAKVIKL
jgi:hypothetical protein